MAAAPQSEITDADPAARGDPLAGWRFWVALAFCLTGIAILLGLGTWQLERLAWKEEMLARIESRIHSEPVTLSEIEELHERTGDVDYLPMRASGRYAHEGEKHFLTTHDREAGWNLYTPLVTEEGPILFVNRGFVPYEMRGAQTRPETLVEGEVEITGLARNPAAEKPGYFVPDNPRDSELLFWRELDALKAALPPELRERPIYPFLLDRSRDPVQEGYPIGGATIIEITNNHLQYAITWYGIGAVLAVMTVLLVRHRLRSGRGERGDARG